MAIMPTMMPTAPAAPPTRSEFFVPVLVNNAGYGAHGPAFFLKQDRGGLADARRGAGNQNSLAPLEALPMDNIRRQFDTKVIGLLERGLWLR